MAWGSVKWSETAWSGEAVTSSAEDLFITWVERNLPRYFLDSDRTKEMLKAFSAMFETARARGAVLFDQTLIGNATTLPPDFLNLHALGRGTSRQSGESDTNLRSRLQNPPGALTPTDILDTINSVLADENITGTGALVEFPRDKAFMSDFTGEVGTGGTFVSAGGSTKFTPTDGWASAVKVGDQLVTSGSNSAGNDGTFTVTVLEGDQVTYLNASGVSETDPTVSWTHNKSDADDNITDGFNREFCNRGYRMAEPLRNTILIILPFGCTDSTEAAVRAALVQKKGAGIFVMVECRQTP